MSKSVGNYIGVNEPANDIYGKVMSIPDELIYTYFELLTNKPLDGLRKIKKRLADPEVNPRDVKHELAFELTALYHGRKGAASAREHFEQVVVRKDRPEEVPEHRLPAGGEPVWLAALLRELGLVKSSSEAMRMISQGAVLVDDRRIEDTEHRLRPSGEHFIKVGKRRFARVVFE